MKYAKIFGLAAAAAMALMAFGAGTASATTLTSPSGTVYTGEIVSSVKAGGSLTLKASGITVTCTESTVAGTPEAQSDTTTVKGPISTLTFSNCPESTVEVLAKGSLEIHAIGSGPNGTLTSSGSRVKVKKSGITCVYETNNTDLGTLTGSTTTKSTAVMDISTTHLIRGEGSSFLCAAEATWEGTYTVTQPDFLDIS